MARKVRKMSEILVTFGFVLLIAGALLIIMGSLSGAKDSKAAFGGVIGPFVIGFGNDPQLTKIAVIASVAAAVLSMLVLLRLL